MRTKLLQTYVLTVGLGLAGCGEPDPSNEPGGGGSDQGTGGIPTSELGGASAALGGSSASTGGAPVGGAATGGSTASGGAATGGSGIGGSGVGGSGVGGSGIGGSGIGGSGVGGSGVGGSGIGGSGTGGEGTGGSGIGGTGTGGDSTGGTGTGGDGTGGDGTGGDGTGGDGTGGTGTGGATGECTVGPPLSGGTDYCSNGLGPLGNGYSYELWMDSGEGTGTNCETIYGVDAAFRATWDLGGGGDFLARAGLSFGSDRTHDDIGTISADYAFTKPEDNGFSWVAVYGWTFEPLTEYYIVEDWSGGRPATNYDFQGEITVDGGTYDIYSNRRINAMSPVGLTDFDQFWSIRQEPSDCGHVSISAHFNEWNSLGMDMGNMREAMVVVEALNGSGTVDFALLTVQVE